ncbi:hypothetical protein AGMMS49944_01460 [Spirochaetia bacterium]|nr:hypothetical protein AGMMS49944_01460 [Spirochaetia bacterium]
MQAQRGKRGVEGRMHFHTQFGDIMAAQREERGVVGRMHPVSLRTETLWAPWGRGSGSRLPG